MKYLIAGDLVKITNAPDGLQQIQAKAGVPDLNGNIVEIVSPSKTGANIWDMQILGGEMHFSMPANSFVFWLAVGQRRAIVAAHKQVAMQSNSSSSQTPSIRDASHGIKSKLLNRKQPIE